MRGLFSEFQSFRLVNTTRLIREDDPKLTYCPAQFVFFQPALDFESRIMLANVVKYQRVVDVDLIGCVLKSHAPNHDYC